MLLIRKLLFLVFRGLAVFFYKLQNLAIAIATGAAEQDHWHDEEKEVWDQDHLFLLQELPIVLSGLMAWEIPILDYFKKGGKIAVIGCGAGRDMIAFAQRGYQVEGMDISDRAIHMAKQFLQQAGVEGKVYVGDIANFVFPGASYDAFIFSWYTYMLIFPREHRILALKNIRKKLANDGCVVITYKPFNGEGRLMAKIANAIGRLTGNPNPPVVGDCFGLHSYFQHFFTQEELAREAKEAGLSLELCKGDKQAIAILRKGPEDSVRT